METTIIYDKPFKTIDELLELLESRNVIVTDRDFARKCISDISYYSLINGYKDLYPIDKDDIFQVSVPFYEFYNFYRFDSLINNVIFKYIIFIEKSLKSKLSYIISKEYGVYTDLNDFINLNQNDYLCKYNYRNSRQTQSVIKKIKEEISYSKNESVVHYKKSHNHVPGWILINGIPFGLAIKWYEILKPNNKNYICNQFLSISILTLEEKKEFLKKSFDILRKYRNNIAHGNKVFNNYIAEELPKKAVLTLSNNLITNMDYKKGIGRNDLFAVIIIICTLINKKMKIMFLDEIIHTFSIFNDSVFSTGKTLQEMLGLPSDFMNRLECLKKV